MKLGELASTRSLSVLLVLAGAGAMVVALGADLVGIGSESGFGALQIRLALVGSIMLLAGLLSLPASQRYIHKLNARFTLVGWGALAAVVLLGLLLRFYRIDYQSLWYDEALTVVDSQLPLGEMTERVMIDFAHPPLHHYLLHVWFQLFGIASLQARLFSLVFGTLAMVMLYAQARYLFEPRTALLSAFLLAVSQIAVMYSQEARPYTLLLFVAICSSQLFLVALREHRAWAWWGFACSAGLIVYIHYHGALWVISLALFALVYRKRYAIPTTWLAGGIVLALALLAPWLAFSFVGNVSTWQSTLFQKQPPWFAVNWRTFPSTMGFFNNSRANGVLSPPAIWALLAGGLLLTAPAIYALTPLVRRRVADLSERVARENLVFLAILWLCPMLLAMGLGVTIKLRYDARYILFCIAPYYILVARGITMLERPMLRRALILLLVLFSAYSLTANYIFPYKENYRDALAYLADNYEEADCVVFSPLGKVPPSWFAYHGDHPGLRTSDPDSIASSQVACDRVWFVAYRRVDWAIEQNEIQEQKLETTHDKMEESQYFWVHVSLYLPKKHDT